HLALRQEYFRTREHKWLKITQALAMRLVTTSDLAEDEWNIRQQTTGPRPPKTQAVATKCRRSRTKFTEEQLKILINAFNRKPYPGYAAKQRLALEVNTEESRIQNIQGVRDRRCRTSYTSSQLQTLMNAFMENPYPGIDSREQLAEDIGVPEFGFKTEDLDSVSRKKENLKKLQPKDKTMDKISEMGAFKEVDDVSTHVSPESQGLDWSQPLKAFPKFTEWHSLFISMIFLPKTVMARKEQDMNNFQ
ncbi:hypothetical protein E2I00_016967, partial [Balaenoptera physalus]